MPRVPQEIVDQIIDEVHDDIKTLGACALTSLHWVPRCRQHQHKSLTIGVTFPPRHHSHILFFLKYPHLTHYVRSLNIFSTMDNLGRWPVDFPDTTSLQIMFMTWDVQRQGARDHILTQLPAITTLTLAGVEFDDFYCFTTLLTAFPFLSDLTLGSIRVKGRIVQVHAPYGKLGFALKHLTLRDLDVPTTGLIQWLQSQPTPPRIDSLSMTLDGKKLFYHSAPQQWCTVAGNSLSHLHFDFGWVLVDQDLRNGSIDLRHNSQMRTLEVKTIGLGRFSLSDHEWIPLMLHRLPSSDNLRRITLHIHFYELDQLDSQGLSRIDEALGGCNPDMKYWVTEWRKGLENVEIVLWYNRKSLPDIAPIIQVIQERMPRAAMNGALKCYRGAEYQAVYGL